MSEASCGSARRTKTLTPDGCKAGSSNRTRLQFNWTATNVHLRYSSHTTSYGEKVQHAGFEPAGTQFRSACVSLAVRAVAHGDSRRTAKTGSASTCHSRPRPGLQAFANHNHHSLRATQVGRIRRGPDGLGYLRQQSVARAIPAGRKCAPGSAAG